MLKLSQQELSNLIIKYLVSQKISSQYKTVIMATIKHACEMNDVILNWKKLKKFIKSETTDKLLFQTQFKQKSLILNGALRAGPGPVAPRQNKSVKPYGRVLGANALKWNNLKAEQIHNNTLKLLHFFDNDVA
ncbi:MAG TPA: hypothetical protein VNA18_02850 [Nitrososphaeraceae archaeon]|nr:hypothetical protein [Nitrososphaeraceae archaeon]